MFGFCIPLAEDANFILLKSLVNLAPLPICTDPTEASIVELSLLLSLEKFRSWDLVIAEDERPASVVADKVDEGLVVRLLNCDNNS